MASIIWSSHTFVEPEKKIKSPMQLDSWTKSKAYGEIMSFFTKLQAAIESKPISATPQTPAYDPYTKFFKALEKLLEDNPPVQQPMRFGNKAFKAWHDNLGPIIDQFLGQILPENIKGASIELRVYLLESFGSEVRIDYGTGHELTFAVFLLCLCKIGLLDMENDAESIVRNIFYKYIAIMRKIQMLYMLEPAGSHGVWGQDDYHFLPFQLGGAELVNHQEVKIPDDIHRDHLLEKYKDEYMYLNCIVFIKNTKKGATFAEHSPMLNDISGAATWKKVEQGMVKMYQAEVMHKHPIVQHLKFGSILRYSD